MLLTPLFKISLDSVAYILPTTPAPNEAETRTVPKVNKTNLLDLYRIFTKVLMYIFYISFVLIIIEYLNKKPNLVEMVWFNI
ncbi:Uncharacterised protein [Chlamydia trachomatis]|nr:Uncharacterised protein [Chlamydia trachomatis]